MIRLRGFGYTSSGMNVPKLSGAVLIAGNEAAVPRAERNLLDPDIGFDRNNLLPGPSIEDWHNLSVVRLHERQQTQVGAEYRNSIRNFASESRQGLPRSNFP